MDGCGLGCVIFIWVGFLWPVITTYAVLLIKGRHISRKRKYFFVSTLTGYGLFIGANVLVTFLARWFLDTEQLMEKGVNIETLASGMFWTIGLLLYLPPAISSYLLAKRFS